MAFHFAKAYLILERIDDTIPPSVGDYPNNVYTCEPANEAHRDVMLFALRNVDGVNIEVVNGPCPIQEQAQIEREMDRRAFEANRRNEN